MVLAQRNGKVSINPWVVGFIILLLGDMWVFPYQCSHYLQFQEVNRAKGLYDGPAFLNYNLFMNFVRFGGIYLSIPYLTALGIL